MIFRNDMLEVLLETLRVRPVKIRPVLGEEFSITKITGYITDNKDTTNVIALTVQQHNGESTTISTESIQNIDF